MNLDQKHLEDFFEAIELSLPGYNHCFFSYLALRTGDKFLLNQGQLVLHTMPATVPSKYYHSENIRAGFFRLEDLNFGPKAMIDKILSGIVPTPQGELEFPPGQQGNHSMYFSPFHSDGIPIQFRQMNLFIRGERRPQVPTPMLDCQ